MSSTAISLQSLKKGESLHAQAHVHRHTHSLNHTCIVIHVHTHTLSQLYLHAHAHVYTHTYSYTHAHTHIYIHIWDNTLRPAGWMVSRNIIVRWATAELMSSTEPTIWQKAWANDVCKTWLLRTISDSRQRARTVTFSTAIKVMSGNYLHTHACSCLLKSIC